MKYRHPLFRIIGILCIAAAIGFAFGAFATPWEDTKQIIDDNPVLDGIPIMWTEPDAVVLMAPNGFAVGAYDESSNQVFIAPTNYYVTKHVLLHESAHYFWFNDLSQETRDWYCMLFELEGFSPSRYGQQTCVENYAEMFSALAGSRYRMFSGIDDVLWSDQAHIIRKQLR